MATKKEANSLEAITLFDTVATIDTRPQPPQTAATLLLQNWPTLTTHIANYITRDMLENARATRYIFYSQLSAMVWAVCTRNYETAQTAVSETDKAKAVMSPLYSHLFADSVDLGMYRGRTSSHAVGAYLNSAGEATGAKDACDWMDTLRYVNFVLASKLTPASVAETFSNLGTLETLAAKPFIGLDDGDDNDGLFEITVKDKKVSISTALASAIVEVIGRNHAATESALSPKPGTLVESSDLNLTILHFIFSLLKGEMPLAMVKHSARGLASVANWNLIFRQQVEQSRLEVQNNRDKIGTSEGIPLAYSASDITSRGCLSNVIKNATDIEACDSETLCSIAMTNATKEPVGIVKVPFTPVKEPKPILMVQTHEPTPRTATIVEIADTSMPKVVESWAATYNTNERTIEKIDTPFDRYVKFASNKTEQADSTPSTHYGNIKTVVTDRDYWPADVVSGLNRTEDTTLLRVIDVPQRAEYGLKWKVVKFEVPNPAHTSSLAKALSEGTEISDLTELKNNVRTVTLSMCTLIHGAKYLNTMADNLFNSIVHVVYDALVGQAMHTSHYTEIELRPNNPRSLAAEFDTLINGVAPAVNNMKKFKRMSAATRNAFTNVIHRTNLLDGSDELYSAYFSHDLWITTRYREVVMRYFDRVMDVYETRHGGVDRVRLAVCSALHRFTRHNVDFTELEHLISSLDKPLQFMFIEYLMCRYCDGFVRDWNERAVEVRKARNEAAATGQGVTYDQTDMLLDALHKHVAHEDASDVSSLMEYIGG